MSASRPLFIAGGEYLARKRKSKHRKALRDKFGRFYSPLITRAQADDRPRYRRKPQRFDVVRAKFPTEYRPPYSPPTPDKINNLGDHWERKGRKDGEYVYGYFTQTVWWFRGPTAERDVRLLLQWIREEHPDCRAMVSIGTGFGADWDVPAAILRKGLVAKEDMQWWSSPYDTPGKVFRDFENIQSRYGEKYQPIKQAQAKEIAWFRVEMLCPAVPAGMTDF